MPLKGYSRDTSITCNGARKDTYESHPLKISFSGVIGKDQLYHRSYGRFLSSFLRIFRQPFDVHLPISEIIMGGANGFITLA